MATIRDPVKPEPVAKYEAFVEEKLTQARSRIRMLDFGAGLLGFLAGTMVFALTMGVLDRWFQLSVGARQFVLAIYGVAAVAYLAAFVIWPMIRRLNPYYAARQVETVLPGAKNSVINWLDLRHEPMPSAFRGAVSHRAAKDIAQANLEEAISDRRTLSLGVVTLVLFLITVAFMFFGPGLSRVFQPFGATISTEIRIIKPEGGNGSVAEGRAVSVEAEIVGRQSEPLRFLYRHHQTDPYEERPMERGDSSHDWVITIPAFEVHNGFWYKVVGSEAETAEYHIEVRSAPAFTEFEVTYHPRPYLHLSDETIKTHQPDLKGLRGTDVQILAHTNRRIRCEDSGLIIAGQPEAIKAEPVPNDPQTMRFHLVLDKNGTYGIQFTSEERERNRPIFYNITVLPDNAPEVRIAKPEGETVALPFNGILQVEGSATDDHGITGFTLRMQVKDRPEEPLQAQQYRPGKGFQLADGSYPTALDYADVAELAKLQRTNLQPLQPGMVIEYWLEATDNCDYPGPNVGRSNSKFFTIKPPDADKQKIEKEKDQARKEKEKKQAEQDQKLEEQNQAKQQAQPEQKDPAEEKAADQKPADQKQADQKQPEDKPANQKQAEEKPAEQKQPSAEQQPSQEKKFDEIKKKLEEQLKQQEAKEKNPDGNNPDGQKDHDQNKGDGNKKPDGKKGNDAGQPKPKPDDGQGMGDQKQPDKKDGQSDAKPDQGQGNQDGPQKPDPRQKGKDGRQNKDEKGDQDGGPKPGKKNQEPPDDSNRGDKKERDKGPGSESNPADKKAEEKGPANSNSPPKPGMNDKAPPKDGQGDQPGQENPTGNQAKKPDSDKGKQPDKDGPNKGNASKNDGSPEKKSDTDQAKPNDGQSGAKSDKPGNEQGSNKGEMAKKIGDLLKKMKDGDAQTREQARKELQEMSEQAKSPADREAAKEALKKADESSKPGDQSGQGQDNKPGDKAGDSKGEPGKGNAGKKGQGSDPDKNQTPQKGDKKPGEGGKPGEGDPKAKDEKKSEGSGSGKGEQGESKGAKGEQNSDQTPGKPGSNSGGVPQGPREAGSSEGSGPEAAKGAEANPAFQKKAGSLQLENYKKKITKEMLDKAKISDQEYKDFLKAYDEKLKREAAEKTTPDKLPDARRTGGNRSNQKSHQLQSTDKKEDKLQHAGKAEPPPGFGQAYKEFTEETAKSRTSSEKKK